MFSNKIWRFLWRSEDTRRKVLITLALVILYRLLLNVPLPGIAASPDIIQRNITPGTGLHTLLEFLSMLSGSSLLTVSVLALGLLPYNLTSVVLSLLIPLVPGWQRRFSEDSRAAKEWFERWNAYLAFPVAILESFLFLFLISPNCEGRLFLLEAGEAHLDFLFTVTTIILLVAGSYLAVWIAGLISEYGIRKQGNSILLASGIIGQMSSEFAGLLKTRVEGATLEQGGILPQLPERIGLLLTDPGRIETLIGYAILFVACIVAVVYLQGGRRNVIVMYPSSSAALFRSRRIGAPVPHLPLTLTVGTDGLIGSQLFVSLTTFYAPLATCTQLPGVNAGAAWLIGIFGESSLLFGPIAFFSVVFFTYFYSDMIFQQQNYGENLRRAGARIPGVNPQAAQRYLSRINRRITLAPALILGLLAIAPWFFSIGFGIKLSLLEGEKLLIIVGVIRDAFMTIDAELKIQGYEDYRLVK